MQVRDQNGKRRPLSIRALLGQLLLTKGDTVVRGADGVVVESVGADGTIHSADSSQESGRKWIPVAAPLAHAASHAIGGADALAFQAALICQTAAGTAFNTYTTAKSVIPSGSLYTIPANSLSVGKAFRIRVMGSFSNVAITPGTATFQMMAGSTVIWTSGAIQLNATAHTTLPFSLDLNLVCRAIGSGTSANFMGMGTLLGSMFTVTIAQVDGVNSETVLQVPRTAPAVGGGFDSTAANILDFWVGFSISSATNQVQVQTYLVEALN